MPAPSSSPRRRSLLAVAGGGFALVLLLRLWLQAVGPLPGDRWSLRFSGWPPPPAPWDQLTTFFDVLGTPLIAAGTVACVVVLVRRSDGLPAVRFVVAACAGVAANALLKLLLGPTPLWAEHVGAHSRNFPSGHTVYAVVLGGALAVLALRHDRRDVAAMLVGLVVLMGPTRVIGGSHLVSDVIAGYLMGAAWLAGAWLLAGPSVGGPARSGRTDRSAEDAPPAVLREPPATRLGR